MSVVVRRLAYAENRSYMTYRTYIENAPPEVAANTMLCLIHQTNYLLDQQIRQLEQAFVARRRFHGTALPRAQRAEKLPAVSTSQRTAQRGTSPAF